MKRIITSAVALSSIMMILPSHASENGFYATGMVGYSIQAKDVEPYGNNIAVDPDFPRDFDGGDGLMGGVGVGYRYSNFRVEARFAMRENEFDEGKVGTGARAGQNYIADGKIQSQTFTVEGFYDWHNTSPITPYLKGGIGYSHNKYKTRLGGNGVAAFDAADGTVDGFYDAYADGSDDNFVWLLGLGASYAASDNISVFAEYQYISLGDVRTGQDGFTDGFKIDEAASHEIMMGLRYQF